MKIDRLSLGSTYGLFQWKNNFYNFELKNLSTKKEMMVNKLAFDKKKYGKIDNFIVLENGYAIFFINKNEILLKNIIYRETRHFDSIDIGKITVATNEETKYFLINDVILIQNYSVIVEDYYENWDDLRDLNCDGPMGKVEKAKDRRISLLIVINKNKYQVYFLGETYLIGNNQIPVNQIANLSENIIGVTQINKKFYFVTESGEFHKITIDANKVTPKEEKKYLNNKSELKKIIKNDKAVEISILDIDDKWYVAVMFDDDRVAVYFFAKPTPIWERSPLFSAKAKKLGASGN